jgi:hypothetical protein
MTSEPTEAFVWTWLPGAEEPVVAGRIELARGIARFNYGRSYLGRHEAIPLYLPELPLRPGAIEPLGGLAIPCCIKDAGPDAWGQRVVMQHLLGAGAQDGDSAVFGALTYLLRSGSDRIGALDFQEHADIYVSRDDTTAPLEDLMEAADRVSKGEPLPPALDLALLSERVLGVGGDARECGQHAEARGTVSPSTLGRSGGYRRVLRTLYFSVRARDPPLPRIGPRDDCRRARGRRSPSDRRQTRGGARCA